MCKNQAATSTPSISYIYTLLTNLVFICLYLVGYVSIYYALNIKMPFSIALIYGLDFLCGSLSLKWFYNKVGRLFIINEIVLFCFICFLFFILLGMLEVSFQNLKIPFFIATSELVFVFASIYSFSRKRH